MGRGRDTFVMTDDETLTPYGRFKLMAIKNFGDDAFSDTSVWKAFYLLEVINEEMAGEALDILQKHRPALFQRVEAALSKP